MRPSWHLSHKKKLGAWNAAQMTGVSLTQNLIGKMQKAKNWSIEVLQSDGGNFKLIGSFDIDFCKIAFLGPSPSNLIVKKIHEVFHCFKFFVNTEIDDASSLQAVPFPRLWSENKPCTLVQESSHESSMKDEMDFNESNLILHSVSQLRVVIRDVSNPAIHQQQQFLLKDFSIGSITANVPLNCAVGKSSFTVQSVDHPLELTSNCCVVHGVTQKPFFQIHSCCLSHLDDLMVATSLAGNLGVQCKSGVIAQ